MTEPRHHYHMLSSHNNEAMLERAHGHDGSAEYHLSSLGFTRITDYTE